MSQSSLALAALFAAAGAIGVDAHALATPPTHHAAVKPVPEVTVDAVADAAPAGLMIPREVALRPTTPAERDANAVWSTRAALNIAALQCQFSPFLSTVRNYNDFLRQHAEELDRARTVMLAHFKRYDGTQAQNSFDHYTTQTYNSYSTLDAQYSFCEAAATAGRMTLTVRKGDLSHSAGKLRDQMRAALVPASPLDLQGSASSVPGTVPQL